MRPTWQISDDKLYIDVAVHRGFDCACAKAFGYQIVVRKSHTETFSYWDVENWCDHAIDTVENTIYRTDHICEASIVNDDVSYEQSDIVEHENHGHILRTPK